MVAKVGPTERERKKSGGGEKHNSKIDIILVEFILRYLRIDNKLIDILVDTCFENDRYVYCYLLIIAAVVPLYTVSFNVF